MIRKFKVFVAFSIFFALVACGAGGPSAPQESKQITQILSEAAGNQLQEIAPDGTMIFDLPEITPQATYIDGQLNDMSSVKKGDILVSGPTSSARYGFLNRVTSVQIQNGKANISTQRATLEDAIRNSDIEPGTYKLRSKNLSLKDATVVYDPQIIDVSGEIWNAPDSLYGSPIQLDPQARIGVSRNYCFSDKTVKNGSTTLATISGCINPSAFAELELDIGFRWLIIPTVDRFMTKVGGNVIGDVKIETANAKVRFDKSITLASYIFSASTFYIGPIPVVLTPRLNVVLNIDGSVSYETSINAVGNVGFELGGEYTHSSGWRPIKSFTHDFNITAKRGDPLARIQSSIAGAEVGVYLYDTIGPVVGVDPYASAEAKIGTKDGRPFTSGSLYAGVDAYVKIDSKRFFGFLEKEWRYNLLNKRIGSF